MNYHEKQIETTIKFLDSARKSILDEIPYRYIETGYKQNNLLPRVTEDWCSSEENNTFFGWDRHYWFYAQLTTPAAINGKRPYLYISKTFENNDLVNPQSIVYINGEMICGLDVNHREIELEFGRDYEIYIYYYTGTNKEITDEPVKFAMHTMLLDIPVNTLYYDLDVPHKAALCYDEEDEIFLTIIKHLAIAVNMLDLCDVGSDSYCNSMNKALRYMHDVFYKTVCGGNAPIVSGIGHTHIDVAWLWTYAQTKEKVQRSFTTVLMLMDRYPEYKFMSSQPQLYQYLKDEAPEVYEKVKKRVSEGRWEVEGGMWVEADCNLISGESMVRQFLHGKKFIKDEFGKDSHILWLPDVFGYSAAMPQIMKKCGIDTFFTSKISWNELNKMPYDIFMWQGIDGSRIFSYFATAQEYERGKPAHNFSTYIALLTPAEIKGTWNRFQQKDYSRSVLSTFGYGDGGGGPTDIMLETQRRTAFGIPGLPKTKIAFAEEFFNEAKKQFFENAGLLKEEPRWCGELYLEYHRGTYTNIARNKRYNRKSELLYQYAETISAADMVLNGGKYNADMLYKNWEIILLNQFHDVIPGSSIKEVYRDSDKMYDKITQEGEELVTDKLNAFADNIAADEGIIVFNPTGFMQDGVVTYDGKKYYCKDIPPYGWKNVLHSEHKNTINVCANTAENEYFILTIDENGNISSLYDKRADKDVFSGVGNQFELYEDRPYCYDGWEISKYHKYKKRPINEIENITAFNDDFCAGFIIERKFSKSSLRQKIVMYADKARIDFETEVDWKESNMLLKTAFPINVLATKATYDIQFGNVERPTHKNTTWDAAKFEVCAHKWADISDGGYGVSLLNDCKYGHSAEDSTLRLTLLKSATYPNPGGDCGKHKFVYSIYPHIGDFKQGKTVREAYQLNNPLRCAKAGGNGSLDAIYSFARCENENIVIDTIKKAECGNDIIIRAYECHNCRTPVEFDFGFDFKKAYICDMLENNEKELVTENNKVKVDMGNYEILTLRLCRE